MGIEGLRYRDEPEGGAMSGDADGERLRVQDSVPGQDGMPGQEGTPGQDGMLPQEGSRSGEDTLPREDTLSGEDMPLVYIHVCGLVSTPGVYGLPAGSRVYEAIEAAGGFSEAAVPDYLNLAQVLEDGMKIQVPDRDPGRGVEGPGADPVRYIHGRRNSRRSDVRQDRERRRRFKGQGES